MLGRVIVLASVPIWLRLPDALLEVNSRQDYERWAPVMSWVLSWMSSHLMKGMASIDFVREIYEKAPGKGGIPADQAVSAPFKHFVFSKLCLWSVEIALKYPALTERLLETKEIMTCVMYALAKCDAPETSCRLASAVCEKITEPWTKRLLIRVFLENYCFLSAGTGPFQQGVSIYRCLPLAAFLKGVSTDMTISDILHSVTMHHLVEVREREIEYWLKALRISGLELEAASLGTVTQALSRSNEVLLIANLLAPLPPGERSRVLLRAWILSAHRCRCRSRAFSLSSSRFQERRSPRYPRSEAHRPAQSRCLTSCNMLYVIE